MRYSRKENVTPQRSSLEVSSTEPVSRVSIRRLRRTKPVLFLCLYKQVSQRRDDLANMQRVFATSGPCGGVLRLTLEIWRVAVGSTAATSYHRQSMRDLSRMATDEPHQRCPHLQLGIRVWVLPLIMVQ
jgi:hypothetical protein